MSIHLYKTVLLCEKVAVTKMVSAGRGRRRRIKTVFKWQCRPTMRMMNEGEYPVMQEEVQTVKITVFDV